MGQALPDVTLAMDVAMRRGDASDHISEPCWAEPLVGAVSPCWAEPLVGAVSPCWAEPLVGAVSPVPEPGG